MKSNLITMTIYLAILFIIAIIANRHSKSHEGYLIGDRSLNVLTAAISAGAADMSGWLLLGLPGAVYLYGLNQIWIPIGLSIGAFLNWSFVSNKLREKSAKLQAITIPDFLAKQVNDTGISIRVVSSVIIVIFFTIYITSCFVSGAKVLSEYFAISYTVALFLTFIFITLITVIGGFLAVSWGEICLGFVMIIIMVLIPTLSFLKITNTGNIGFLEKILNNNSNALNIFHNMSFIGVLSLLAWGLGYFGQPHILAKFMAMKSANNYKKSRIIAITWMVMGLAFACLIGLLGANMFSSLKDNELVMLEISQAVLHPYFISLIIIAIISAIFNTSTAQLLVVSSVFTNDLKIVKNTATMNRIIVISVGIMALLLGLNPKSSILSIVAYAWAGFGASFGPILLLSLNSKKTIQKIPALIGIIVGGSTVILWNTARKYLPNIDIFSLYELLPAFVLSFLSIILLNLKSYKNKEISSSK